MIFFNSQVPMKLFVNSNKKSEEIITKIKLENTEWQAYLGKNKEKL